MKLDHRIKKLTDILTCVNAEEAKKFIGQKGYFSDNICNFDDLSVKDIKSLTKIFDYEMSFVADDDTHWRYFIPECRLKPVEKKYRPYTMEDFAISEFVVFREKSNPLVEYHVRYNGYKRYDNIWKVILGNISYTFDDLFEDFEYLDSGGKWKPFGVEE